MPQKNYPSLAPVHLRDCDLEQMRDELISFKYLEAIIDEAENEPLHEESDNMKGYFSTFKPSNWPHHFPYTLRMQKKIRDALLPSLPNITISDNYLIAPRNMEKFKGGEYSTFYEDEHALPWHSDKWEGLVIPRYLDTYDTKEETVEDFKVLDHIQRIEQNNRKDSFSNQQTVAVVALREIMDNLQMRSNEKHLFKELMLTDEELRAGDPKALYLATTRMKEMFQYCMKHSEGDRYEDDLIELMIQYVDEETPNSRENAERLLNQKPYSTIIPEEKLHDTFGNLLAEFFKGCPSVTLNFIIPSERGITAEESGQCQVRDKWGNETTHSYHTGLLRVEHFHRVINNVSRTCLQTYIYGATYDQVYEAFEALEWKL